MSVPALPQMRTYNMLGQMMKGPSSPQSPPTSPIDFSQKKGSKSQCAPSPALNLTAKGSFKGSPPSSWSRSSSPLSPSMEPLPSPSILSPAPPANNHAFSPWARLTPPGSAADPFTASLLQQQHPHPHLLPQQGTCNGLQGGVPVGGKVRATRPFKAYPKDPMTFPTVYALPMGAGTEALLNQQSHQAYSEFRKQMLASSQMTRGRRASRGQSHDEHPSPPYMDTDTDNERPLGGNCGGKTEQQMKDEAYWERRRKNNEAAKRSRDARRAKEDEIAIRAAFLEQENLKLRFELCALKNETAKLRCMLYSS